MSFLKRSPTFQQVMRVFAITSMLVYGWTTYRMLVKLPSWLLYLNAYEVLSGFCYAWVFNFLECVLVTGALTGLTWLLPRRFFAERFVSRGAALVLLGGGYLIYLALSVGQSKANLFPWDVFAWSPFIMALILIVAFVVVPRFELINRFLEDLADRALVFLYVFIPLTVIGFVIVAVNNLT